MTETTITQQQPEAATDSDIPIHSSDILMNLIVTLLAPMFLGTSAGDVGFARMAAIATVNAYGARTHADLVLIAQIIGFGLAALGSLSLSMTDNISLSMTLRLRGNAVACNRSAEQNRRALEKSHGSHSMPHQAAIQTEPETDAASEADEGLKQATLVASAAAAQQLAAEAQTRMRDAEQSVGQIPNSVPIATSVESLPITKKQRHTAMWAAVMASEAGKLAASLPGLPPAERRAASIRTAALTSTANSLLSGVHAPSLVPAIRAATLRPQTG